MKLIHRFLLLVSIVILVGIGLGVYAPHAMALTPAVSIVAQTTEPPATAPVVPPEFYAALLGLVAYFVTQGLKSLSTFLAQYPALSWIAIGDWGSVIAAFLVTGLMFYLNIGIGLVPPPLIAAVPFLFQFLLALFTAYGSHLTVKTIGGST